MGTHHDVSYDEKVHNIPAYLGILRLFYYESKNILIYKGDKIPEPIIAISRGYQIFCN